MPNPGLRWDHDLILEIAGRENIRTQRELCAAYAQESGQRLASNTLTSHLAEHVDFRALVRDALGPYRAPAPDPSMKPRTVVKGDTATIVSTPSPDLGDLEELIRSRGLSPLDWDVVSATLNCWESNAGAGEIIELKQLKVSLRKRVDVSWLFPAVDVKPRQVKTASAKQGHQTVVLIGDQHAPYHDRKVHGATLALLSALKPDKLVCLGDVGDYPSISRWRDNPAWNASAQECIQGSYELLSDYRSAHAGEMFLLAGNHDWRLATELLSRAERMYGIAPADIPGHEQVPAFSLRHLLHLDALGVQYVEPELAGDEYDHAELWLSERLVAIHGKHTKNGAEKHAERMGASVVMGHSHALKQSKVVRWTGAEREEFDAVEAGCVKHVGVSVGYANRPLWANGCVVATVHKDGSHHVELVPWDGTGLHFRGERIK